MKKTSYVNGTDTETEYIDSKPENLINLLPDSHHSFYTYKGSLTTPPCYEVVTWVLLSEPVYMAQESLEELSNIEAANELLGRYKISANHREIQPLLDRPVYASFNTTDSISTSFDTDKKITTTITTNGQFMRTIRVYWQRINKLQERAKKAINGAREARKSMLKLAIQRLPRQQQQQQQETPPTP